jgi:hypothetical protein
MYVIASIGAALTGLGGALLARALGASRPTSEHIALVFPVLPFALISLDICTPDALALGLALLALALDADGKTWPAIVIAILAVLTRETSVLILAGWFIARGRRAIAMLAAPAAVAAAWWLWLRITVPDRTGSLLDQFDLRGLARAVATWSRGHELLGAVTFVAAVVLAVVTLTRVGVKSPLGPAIIIQLVFLAFLTEDVIGPNYNGPRAVGPLLALAVIALAADPNRKPQPEPAEGAAH